MNKKVGLILKVFLLLCVGLSALSVAADSDSQFAGIWTGSWEGGGTGKFDVTLVAGSDGKLAGSVNVGAEGGDYTAKFSSLSFDGNKLAAKYAYPLDEQGEVTLTATFDGNKATGTWALGAKGQAGQAMANGT